MGIKLKWVKVQNGTSMSVSKRYPNLTLALIHGRVRTELDNGHSIITHLQKYSHFFVVFHQTGFIPTLHVGIMWRLQEENTNPESLDPRQWIPGTEQGIYFRTPGLRWDSELGMKWTWGYFGLHLD